MAAAANGPVTASVEQLLAQPGVRRGDAGEGEEEAAPTGRMYSSSGSPLSRAWTARNPLARLFW